MSPVLALPGWAMAAVVAAAVWGCTRRRLFIAYGLVWAYRWRYGLIVVAGLALAGSLGTLPASLHLGGGGAPPASRHLAATAPVPAAYRAWIDRAGSQCAAITPAVIAAQLNHESGFDPHAHSAAGALGIAQFLPVTWASWGAGGDVWNPRDAIAAQGRFMCHMANQARADVAAGRASGSVLALALAGYNAGYGRVQHYHGVPPFAETTNYVASITASARLYAQQEQPS
jgi:soluble lytic murein transglycosylase-like protein